MGFGAFLVPFLASKKTLADEIRGQPKSPIISKELKTAPPIDPRASFK